jgi:hypothetical protein
MDVMTQGNGLLAFQRARFASTNLPSRWLKGFGSALPRRCQDERPISPPRGYQNEINYSQYPGYSWNSQCRLGIRENLHYPLHPRGTARKVTGGEEDGPQMNILVVEANEVVHTCRSPIYTAMLGFRSCI